MKNKVKNYLSDDSAMDREVSTILGVVIAIALVMAIAYFVWNMVSSQANTATDLTNQTNPGSGNEFSNTSPFSSSSGN